MQIENPVIRYHMPLYFVISRKTLAMTPAVNDGAYCRGPYLVTYLGED